MPEKHSFRGKFKEISSLTEALLRSKTAEQLFLQLTSKIVKLMAAKLILVAHYDSYSTTFIVDGSYYPKSAKIPNSFDWPVDLKARKQWNFFKQGTLSSNNAIKDARLNREFVKSFSIQNLIIAPMIVSSEVGGLLIL